MKVRWTWLAVAAALGIAALLWARGERPAPVAAVGPRPTGTDVGEVLVGEPGHERPFVAPAPLPASGPGGGDRPDAASASLRLRVVARDGRAPLPGARAVLLLETARSLAEGWAALARALGRAGTADAEGRVRLAWGSEPGTRRVLAWGAGYGAADVRLDAPVGDELTLALPTGLAIEGRVVDGSGAPVPRLAVLSVASRRPRADARVPAPGDSEVAAPGSEPGAERVRVVSDDEGRFRVTGLSAGWHWLSVEEGSWRVRADLANSTTAPLRGAPGLLVEAGAKDALLRVERAARLHLVLEDAETRQPVRAAWATALARVPGAPGPVALTSYAARVARPEDPVPPSRASATSGELEAVVPWDGVATHAAVAVEADGYRPAEVEVALAPGDADPGPQPVPLTREGPGGGCRLVLECGRDVGAFERPDERLLTLCYAADGRRVHARGTPEPGSRPGDERWGFEDLPAGEAMAQVYDGLSLSEPVPVTLARDAEAQARVAFASLTGVVFALHDERGRRVYDADRLLVAPVGRERGLPDRAWATRLDPLREVLLPLAPGSYRFTVSKGGVGYDAGAFTLAAGETRRVEARLGSLRRFVEDRVRRPR